MSIYAPQNDIEKAYLCANCGRHWGTHRASDNACPPYPSFPTFKMKDETPHSKGQREGGEK